MRQAPSPLSWSLPPRSWIVSSPAVPMRMLTRSVPVMSAMADEGFGRGAKLLMLPLYPSS